MYPLIALSTLAFALASAEASPPACHRGPPPEAIEACAGLDDGDPCSFEAPHGRVEGSCWRPDDRKPLACRPEGAPPPPPPPGDRSSH